MFVRYLDLTDEIDGDIRAELEELLEAWEDGEPVSRKEKSWDVSDEYKAAFASSGKVMENTDQMNSDIADFEEIVNRTETDGTST